MSPYEKYSLYIGAVNAVLVLATLIVLCRYTRYTKQIHETSAEQLKELIQQRRLGIMPSILVQRQQGKLVVTNIGNGPAINVKVKPCIEQSEQWIKDEYKFDEISLLLPKASSNLVLRKNGVADSDSASAGETFSIAMGIELGNVTKFKIFDVAQFYDVEGSYYEQPLTESENGDVFGFVKLLK